ncbi:MAG: prephenate dehydratase [Pseudomonadota bacterium]|nr:prephenate dehydratase [Pseudomonadota bacterium]
MSESEQKLQAIRTKIDAIDEQIQKLIVERAICATEVAEVKQAELNFGDTNRELVYYRPEREAQVLKKIIDRPCGPMKPEDMAKLFREIMSTCLSLEQPMQIAYLGPQGTFTEAAAIKHFGHAVQGVPLATIDEVFREVESGSCHFGVVPVENSSEGMVNNTLDCFMNSNLNICGEVELRIHHHFLKSDLTRTDQITRVYAHQQALAQCRKWLDAHYPNVERVAVSSNGEAARRIQGEWHSAAIAGDMAAERYGLQFIAKNIEDNPDNTTRFLMLGRQELESSGDDKTSVIVSTKDRPGALLSLLQPLMDNGISMTRLETRPASSAKWSYVFFIDFEGHMNEQRVKDAIAAIETEANYVRRLGSYPRSLLGVD